MILNRKMYRITLISLMIGFAVFIAGMFVYSIAGTSFFLNSNANFDSTDNNGYSIPKDSSGTIVAAGDSCCGHTDETPPIVTLASPENNSFQSGGGTVTLSVADDNPMDDFLAQEVRYNWDQSTNTSFTESLADPFTTTLPSSLGLHTLYVYASDSAGNWGSVKCFFKIGDPAPIINLVYPTNESVLLGNTTIDMEIIGTPTELVYHWNGEDNATFESPYDLILPDIEGDHYLYIYGKGSAGYWSSPIFKFTVTLNENSVTIPPAPTTTTTTTTTTVPTNQDSPGFLLLPSFLILIVSLRIYHWRKES